MTDRHDVVIVGGGIAGALLGAVLARGGKDVLVLERQVTYKDRVRGEAIPPWGAKAARDLGVLDTILGAGGTWQDTFWVCDDTLPAAIPAPLGGVFPDIPGILNVGHPEHCEALITLAAKEGATVRRGVDGVSVTLGARPGVTYGWEGSEHQAECRLVVGADSRESIVRKALGLELKHGPVWSSFGGMLIDGVADWPENESVIGTEGEFHFLVFPRSGGKVRLYLGHEPGQQPALSGAGKQQAFFDAFQFSSIPGVDRLQAGAVAGPAAFYGSHDCWLDHGGVPYGEGALLVGDAAGYSDPIIGQGVSIAYTDVLGTSEALLSTDDWSPGLFTDYGVERKERMRRIATSAMLHSAVFSDFSPGGRARRAAFHEVTAPCAQGLPHDPADGLMFLAVAVAIQAGGMNMPAEAFTDETVDRVANLGQDEPVPAGKWRLE